MQIRKDAKSETLIMGAVAYDPKVVTIWNGFKKYFAERSLPFDYVLYSNYERQVQALLDGNIHVAWNSPLAWLQTQRLARERGRRAEAIAMRDSDCSLHSVVIVKTDGDLRAPLDLKGGRVAVGADDSPQATLIPLSLLAGIGLEPEVDFEVVRFEVLVGLHGDHIGGERDAARALIENRADAACILEGNYQAFLDDGTLPKRATRVLAVSPEYDHCNFTVLDGAPVDLVARFRQLLLEMSYEDPNVQPLLDLEGLKAWRPGRTEGYRALEQAVARFGTLDNTAEG